MVHIAYFATLRELTGKREEHFAGADTIHGLMLALCDKYGQPFRDFCMTPDGHISKRVNILINGKHILHLDNEATRLKEGDEVSIFPLIGGG